MLMCVKEGEESLYVRGRERKRVSLCVCACVECVLVLFILTGSSTIR